MDGVVSLDPLVSRFEKVLRYYWDGIPVPPFVAGKEDPPRRTFQLRLLGFSPDYYGEVEPIELTNAQALDLPFSPLAEGASVTTSMSSRIGSHYSPLVGLFKFHEAVLRKGKPAEAIKDVNVVVRVPVTPCEDTTSVYTDSVLDYRRHVRMLKLIELYEPLVKEYARMDQQSLRRVVNLATRGLDANSKQWVVREICVANDEYTKWQCEAIFLYMCVNPLFRRIVGPLQVLDRPFPRGVSIMTLDHERRRFSQAHFAEAKQNLRNSRLWSRNSRGFYEAMRVSWEKKFKRLAMFDLSMPEKVCRAGAFLEQLTNSMRAALTKIRVEFYSNLEDFFFSYVADSKAVLSMNASDLETSPLKSVFLAARVFTANKLRELLFENAERLIAFFNANGKGGRGLSPKVATKHPLLQVELIVGSRYEPRSPSFSHLRFGMLDLFDELLKSINGFPLPECAILRTLDLGSACIQVIDAVELASYRSSLMEVLDEVALTIDDMAQQYALFADFPTHSSQVARCGDFNSIRDYLTETRERLSGVEVVSPDVVYAGCFAIVCSPVKQQYAANWSKCLERFYKEYHALISETIACADGKCVVALQAVEKIPKTVTELEEYLTAVKAAGALAKRIRKVECQEVITKFSWMEELQIPVESHVYQSALGLMAWPARLEVTADRSGVVKDECRPTLLAELNRLRTETRSSIRTLSTGVTELYNMFNLEICDIAAQTCSELRELVDHIEFTVNTVRSQEAALGLPTADPFDDLPPLLNYFEIIEQFWSSVYKATGLRELYLTPVSTLNAEKAIEDVREWRRLIHAATRSLRASVPLVRLGRQQELALAKFEGLERLLHLLTTPGLRKSHWKEIARLVAAKMVDDTGQIGDMTVSLQKLIDAGIADYIPDLERIASQARSDYEVETKLEEMKSTAKRTYFQVETVANEIVPRSALGPACRHNIHSLIEQFVRDSRGLRRAAGLSPLVLKAVSEWEVASDRTRDTFLSWEAIDERWGSLNAFLYTLERTDKTAKRPSTISSAASGAAFMLEKLRGAAEALDTIYTTVSKPQFSLYMAIVQESIAENLQVVRTVMDEVTAALKDTFERMRAVFPRFNFVTDSQLATILTPYSTKSLLKLLPHLYGHLSTVTVEDGCVTSFSTGSGGSIPAVTKLPLAHEPTEIWMQRFDQCLTSSVYHSINSCTSEYGQIDLEAWLGNWCTQLIIMALRLSHTKDMRDAIQLAGAAGLCAYRTKLMCLTEELMRIATAWAAEPEGKVRSRLSCAIVYTAYAAKEVELAIAHHVTSCAELDATSMIQTFMTDTTIIVRFFGFDFPYGFMFYGDHQLSFMTPQMVEKTLAMVALSGGAGSTPVVCGGMEKEHALELASQLLGSFLIRLQCCEMISLPALRQYVWGAIEVGALLCVQDCELIPEAALPMLTTCVNQVQECLRLQKESPTTILPLGEGGIPVSVSIDPRFRAVFTTQKVETVPLTLSLNYRTFHYQRLSNAAAVQAFLAANGLQDSSTAQCSVAFGMMYEQFREASPTTFSDAALMAVLRGATLDPLASTLTPDSLMERLLIGFLCVFSPRIREDETLRRLLVWNVNNAIGRSFATDSWRDVLEELSLPTSRLSVEDLFDGFTDMMLVSTNAVVVGSAFSGKTKLWKRWIGSTKHTVFSPSLMTSEDFYGTPSRPGFLASLGRTLMHSGEPHVIVSEDGDLSVNSLWASWPQLSRVPTVEGGFISGPLTRVLVCTRTLSETTPRLVSDFGIFYLPPLRDWRGFLKDCVQDGLGASKSAKLAACGDAPVSQLSEIVVSVLELLLPKVFLAIHPRIPSAALGPKKGRVGRGRVVAGAVGAEDGVGDEHRGLSEDDNNRLFALCQRCTSLYRRWYQHATEQYEGQLGRVAEDYVVDDKALAAQCAVFAVCWSAGLALEEAEQPRITRVLREAEVHLLALAELHSIAEPLLPQVGDREDSVLQYVATRGGWKRLEEAGAYGITLSWATHSHISPQNYAWSQRFPLPSRLSVLGAVECLLNCGQSVMLSGAVGSGKSALLQTIPLNDRWVSQLVSINKSVNPSFVQEEMSTNLSRRSCGRFGPSLGRKLVVCIDDVHLSECVEPDLPLMARLLSFCDKFRAIVTPAKGLIPTTDVVFFGTTVERKYDAMITRSCVQVRLPDFSGGELVNGVWKLLEAACGRKRVENFSRECTSFLTLAHAAFVHLLPSTPASLLLASDDDQLEGTQADSHSPRCHRAVVEGERMLLWRFEDALHAAEFTRQQLMSSTSDVQVATNVFSAVGNLYSAYLGSAGAETEVVVFKTKLAEAAQSTLGTRLRDINFAALVAQERQAELRRASRADERDSNSPAVPSAPDSFGGESRLGSRGAGSGMGLSYEDREKVAEWITEFEVTLDEVNEDELMNKFSLKPTGKPKPVERRSVVISSPCDAAMASTGRDGDEASVDRAETGERRSMLITYTGATGPSTHGRVGTPGSRRGSSSSVRGSRRVSLISGGSGVVGGPRGGGLDVAAYGFTGAARPAAVGSPKLSQRAVSKTYQTTWLTTLLVQLYRAVHQGNSSVVLIGEKAFGMNRLLRLFCSATRKPLAIFRVATESDASRVARVEMRALVMFAYSNDVRTNAFLPFEFLQIPGVLRQVDIIMRSGEINELFSVEERAALARGYRYTHRGAAPLTGGEYVDMRRRVRRNLQFIFHAPSEGALRQLVSGYPAVDAVLSIPLRSPELDASSLREIALGVLTEEKIRPPTAEDLPHSGFSLRDKSCASLRLLQNDAKLAEVISEVFEAFSRTHSGARLEQLMELAREVRRLREVQLAPVLQGAATAATLLGRADEATEKMAREAEQAKEATAQLHSARVKAEQLRVQLAQEEHQHKMCEAAEASAQERLWVDEETLQRETARIQESLLKSEKQLATAASKLRKVKSALIRSLAVMRLPEKGVLLVKSIYRVLNEELPSYGNSPSNLWTLALRYICTPEFPAKMASRVPEEEKDPATLLLIDEELSGVRYGNASPYAQLIADFILAYIAAVRTRIHIREEEEPLRARCEKQAQASKQHAEDLLHEVGKSAARKARTSKQIAEVEAVCVEAETLLKQLADREQYLQRYIGLADRFSCFVSSKQVEERRREARIAEGAIIALASFFALFSPFTGAGKGLRQTREILAARAGVDIAAELDQSCKALLFPGHEELISQFVYGELPPLHRVAFYGLIKRVSCRWSVFGGVCATFESILRDYLSFECAGCSVISAHDPTLKEQITRAMREGEGVVLRDADTPQAMRMLRDLFPLLEQLQRYSDRRVWVTKAAEGAASNPADKRSKTAAGAAAADDRKRRERAGGDAGGAKKAAAASAADAHVKIPFRVFGSDIDVNPRFFLVGTSNGLLEVEDASQAAECVNVINFFTPLPRRMRFRALVVRSIPSKAAGEEVRERRERFYHEFRAYVQVHTAASKLLGNDLEVILAGAPQGELDRIEAALMQLDTHDGQLAHASAQMNSSGRQLREIWEPLEKPLLASADVLEFLEREKLRRPWDDRILDSFVASMMSLSPELTARLAPQLFVDLAKPEKVFYAVVNYVVSVLRCFACGWPAPVRGLFSLLFFSSVVTACGEIAAHRGTLFPREVELLNGAQLAVLRGAVSTLVYADDKRHLQEGMMTVVRQRLLAAFRDSGDVLLHDIAREMHVAASPTECPPSTDSAATAGPALSHASEDRDAFCTTNRGILASCLFRSLVDLDFEGCEAAALQLYGEFMSSVEDTNAIANQDSTASSSVRPPGEVGAAVDSRAPSYVFTAAVPPARGVGVAARTGGGGITSSPVPAALPPRFSVVADVSVQSPSTPVSQRYARGVRGLVMDSASSAEVHSIATFRSHATAHGIPVCFPCTVPATALRALRQRATMEKWAFQWHEVRHTRAIQRVSREVQGCFHRRPFDRLGHLIALYVDVGEGETQSPHDTRDLLAQVHRLLSTFQGYRGSLAAMLNTGGVPVYLILVCTPRVHQLLWGASGEGRERRRSRCLYLNRDFFTPQAHLVALLRDGIIEAGLGTFTTVRKPATGKDGGGGVALRSLRFSDAPTGTGEAEEAGKKPSNTPSTPLEVSATLVAKELAVVHVGFAARQAVRLWEWSSVYGRSPSTPPSLSGTHVNDDDSALILLLQLLHSWVQRQLNIVDAVAAAEGHRSRGGGRDGGADAADPVALYLANLPPGTVHAALKEAIDSHTGRAPLRLSLVASSSPGLHLSSALQGRSSLQDSFRPGAAQATPKHAPTMGAVNPRGSRSPRASDHPPDASLSLGMQAYLFYRNQRPLWRLHTNPAEVGICAVGDALGRGAAAERATTVIGKAGTTVASLRRNLPTLGVDLGEWRRAAAAAGTVGGGGAAAVAAHYRGGPSQTYSTPSTSSSRRSVSLRQLAEMTYAVFQKLAFGVYAASGNSHEDMAAVQLMLAALLVPPQDGPSSAVGGAAHDLGSPGNGSGNAHAADSAIRGSARGGTVSCNLAGLDPCCPLTLDASSDFQKFLADVKGCGSSLMELMGDMQACHLYDRETRKELARLFFLAMSAPAPTPTASPVKSSSPQLERTTPPVFASGAAQERQGSTSASCLITKPLSPTDIQAALAPAATTTATTTEEVTVSQFDECLRDIMGTSAAAHDASTSGRAELEGEAGAAKSVLTLTAVPQVEWQSPFVLAAEDSRAEEGAREDMERDGSDADHSVPGGGEYDEEVASRTVEGSVDSRSDQDSRPPSWSPTMTNSPAALALRFEESSLRHLYDAVFNPTRGGAHTPSAARLLRARRLVLDTTRSLAGGTWQSPPITWTPEDGSLCVWMPALRRPYVTLTLVLSTMEEALARRAASESLRQRGTLPLPRPLSVGQRVSPAGGEPSLMVLVTQRRLLAPTDILAGNARLSPLMAVEVARVAGWTGEPQNGSGYAGEAGSMGTTAARGDVPKHGEDVVVAFRFARVTRSRRLDTATGMRRMKSVSFFGIHESGGTLSLRTLRVPKAPQYMLGGGVGFLWRTPALVSKGIVLDAAAQGDDRGASAQASPIRHSLPHTTTRSPSITAHAAAADTFSDESQPSRPAATPTPPSDPTFVTATDGLDSGGGVPARGVASPPPRQRLQYALSRLPIPFYARALHADDVHAVRGGGLTPVGGSGQVAESLPDAAGAPTSRGESPAPAAPRSRWRDPVRMNVCVLFEAREAASSEDAGVARVGTPSSKPKAATAQSGVDAVPVMFPHPGALGLYVVCDW